jgi:hypothetical protein
LKSKSQNIAPSAIETLKVRGAGEHNLKGINVEDPSGHAGCADRRKRFRQIDF